MINTPKPKPLWPNDAVMLVCETPERANRETTKGGVIPVVCRDCEKKLVASGYSLGRAKIHAESLGRPVKCFCMDCFLDYDLKSVNVLEDHRQFSESTKNLGR